MEVVGISFTWLLIGGSGVKSGLEYAFGSLSSQCWSVENQSRGFKPLNRILFPLYSHSSGGCTESFSK